MSIFTKGPPFDLTRHHALRVEVTFFSNQYAKSQTAESLTLHELAERIQKTSGPTKDKLPWLKLAAFGNLKSDVGCLRHNDNVVATHGVEGDYDGEVITLDAAVAVAKQANLHAVFYTSASHTDAAPRWRILVPCSRPMPPVMRALLLARVNGLYGGVLSPESFMLSQSYYFGSVNSNPSHRAVVVEGDCIDLRPDLDAEAVYPSTYNADSQHEPSELLADDPALLPLALAAIPNDDVPQPEYNKIGMACWAASGGSEEGFKAFDDWAKKSKKYHGGTRKRWRHYFRSPPNRVGAGTIFFMAQEANPNWRGEHNAANIEHGAAVTPNVMPSLRLIEDDPRFNQTEEDQAEGGRQADVLMPSRLLRRQQGPLSGIPQHLLNVPGILGEAVTYYEATAAKTQPQFAVQAALALGSVVMGRRFCTDQENYSSLYFLNVSQSATGKEHTKTVLERLLEAAELTKLIGPPGYTSASGVFSSLLQQPTHLCIIDELGRMLQSNRAVGNAHRIDAVTILMEAFGRLHTTLRQQGYSKVGMTEKQIEAFDKVVLHPALTLITMTTPGSLYENLSSGDIINGFLARFVIVESFLPRQVSNYTSAVPVPNRLTDWMRAVAQGVGDLTSIDTHAIAPSPGIIPFDPECRGMLRDWERHLLREMNALDPARMETMLGRTKEIAQRLALIVAGSCSASSISKEHLQWAIDYAFFYGQRAITRLRANVADAPFEAACKAVYDVISKGGVRGATHAELVEKTRKYAGLEPRRQREVIESLALSHGVALRESATGGRPRRAWVAKIEAVDD